jgi:hypothetical protein
MESCLHDSGVAARVAVKPLDYFRATVRNHPT